MNVLYMYNKMWANSQKWNCAVWNVFWDVEVITHWHVFPTSRNLNTRGLLVLRGQQEMSEPAGLIMNSESRGILLQAMVVYPGRQMIKRMRQGAHWFEASLHYTFRAGHGDTFM